MGYARAGSSPAFGTKNTKPRSSEIAVLSFFTPYNQLTMTRTCKTLKKIKFYTVNLPLIVITIPFGFLFELIVTLPFIIGCAIDRINISRKFKENR